MNEPSSLLNFNYLKLILKKILIEGFYLWWHGGFLKRIPNGFMFLPVTCLNLRIGLKSHLHTYIYINIHRQSEVDGHFLSLPWSIYINRE